MSATTMALVSAKYSMPARRRQVSEPVERGEGAQGSPQQGVSALAPIQVPCVSKVSSVVSLTR